MTPRSAHLVVLAALAAACGSSGDDADAKRGPGSGTQCAEFSKTDFAGDCLALPVPDPEAGMQVRYGPKSYAAADVEPFILEAGGEKTDVLYMQAPNDRAVLFNSYSARVRPGSHHLIVTHGPGETDFFLNEEQELPPFHFDTLFGIQAGSVDVPDPELPIAPEDSGLAFSLEPGRQIAISAHFINTSEAPLLREAWFNVMYADPAKITEVAAPIFLVGGIGMEVQPKSKELIFGEAIVPNDMRIVWLFAHFHTHTTRFSAYVVNPENRSQKLIYETFDYEEPLYAAFNTQFENPPLDAAHREEGALSGLLELKAGDVVRWECEVVNDDDFVLKFANKLRTAEMCALFGFYSPAPGGKAWKAFAL